MVQKKYPVSIGGNCFYKGMWLNSGKFICIVNPTEPKKSTKQLKIPFTKGVKYV